MRALTIKDFCKTYNIGRSTTYREINEGRLKAVKVRSKTLIPYDAAEAWLSALSSDCK